MSALVGLGIIFWFLVGIGIGYWIKDDGCDGHSWEFRSWNHDYYMNGRQDSDLDAAWTYGDSVMVKAKATEKCQSCGELQEVWRTLAVVEEDDFREGP